MYVTKQLPQSKANAEVRLSLQLICFTEMVLTMKLKRTVRNLQLELKERLAEVEFLNKNIRSTKLEETEAQLF